MITDVCQRWRDRRGSYRPAGEVFDPRDFEVATLQREAARAFVERHHYEGSYPAAKVAYGMFRRGGELAGAAVFAVPVNAYTLAGLPGDPEERTLLSRFVLLSGDDGVKGNGESWFIARTFELLAREGFRSVVSFSDPEPRTALDGSLVFPGHIGIIYQATNAVYTGRQRPDTQRLLPDGTVLHARAIAKLKSGERGWTTARDLLVAHGAEPLERRSDGRAWAEVWVPRLTRKRRHGGNHRYLFGLTPGARRLLRRREDRCDYPKTGRTFLRLPGFGGGFTVDTSPR